ncbi:MAG: cellulase family glycosylhydrolase, partial [Acidobacteria bacterium]|nr:cellulase family glycosylhydrolase [Acidobacteriota bacterium]
RRQAELERRQEEEREREREEERRQEALRQTQEFEAALEAAQERRATFLARFREQKRAERRLSEREENRRDLLREILRDANRLERNEERNEAEQESARRAERNQQSAEQRQRDRRQAQQEAERHAAARQAQRLEQREAERDAEQSESRRESLRQARREEQREAEQESAQSEARRAAVREQRREEDRANERTSARAAEARAVRRDEAEEQVREETRADERRETQRQEQRQERQDAERRLSAREARRQEQRNAESKAEETESRRDSERQSRRKTEQSDQQRQSARQARLAEQREAAQAAERSTEARAAQQEQRRLRTQQEEQARQRRREPSPAPARNPLQARIPSGAISGSLSWLRVSDNRIVNLDSVPVILRGVNLLGLDSAPPDPERGFAAGAGITEETIDAALDWGATIIRVAINHQRVLNGSGAWSGWDYLADLDWIIRRAAEGGAYTMLSLHRLDETTVFGTLPDTNSERTPNFIAPQPDYDTVGMWRLIGERYAEEPAVLFDLYTSPHAALEDDLTGFDTDWDLWTLWVRMIVAELRLQHPRALCFVSGLNWATDLSGFPVIGTEGLPIPNLVYAAHLYPRRDDVWSAIRPLARRHAVFATEWGGGPTDAAWGERTALALRAEAVGWTAAHWNAEPKLVQRTARGIAPTLFGAVVRRALALTDEPLSVRSGTMFEQLNLSRSEF